MQRSALCRSRRELSNEYSLEKIGVDTAENEPLEVWWKIFNIIHWCPYCCCFCWSRMSPQENGKSSSTEYIGIRSLHQREGPEKKENLDSWKLEVKISGGVRPFFFLFLFLGLRHWGVGPRNYQDLEEALTRNSIVQIWSDMTYHSRETLTSSGSKKG